LLSDRRALAGSTVPRLSPRPRRRTWARAATGSVLPASTRRRGVVAGRNGRSGGRTLFDPARRTEQLDGALVDGRLRVQALANLVLLIARRP